MKLQPLNIGSVIVNDPIILAPMAGYTDAAFRSLCLEQGASLVVTEMVNAMGIVLKAPHTLQYLETYENEHPVAAHIYGSKPDIMGEAAAIVESMNRFDFIDINAGCPVPKIMSRGDGAGLLRNPEKLHQVVKAVCASTSLPVTVKTRIGVSAKHPVNMSEIGQSIEEGGAKAIFLHARFAKDRHTGPAQWEALAKFKKERSIPVVGNGGIKDG